MQKEKEGQDLLNSHKRLLPKLLEIPQNRPMNYNEIIQDEKRIGKPRFLNRIFTPEDDILTNLHDHLQKIWNFFSDYSYWFDHSIYPLIAYKEREISNKSIMFLIKHDVWETNEVFGDYLIEVDDSKLRISYYRFNERKRTFNLPKMENEEIKKWIRNDAKTQIKKQIEYLWNGLESEIKACINESFSKTEKIPLSKDYLKEQLSLIKKYYQIIPESCMLSLGRVSELWELTLLNKDSRGYNEDLIKCCLNEGVFNLQQAKIMKDIRRDYNRLKHDRAFKLDQKKIKYYITKLSELIKKET